MESSTQLSVTLSGAQSWVILKPSLGLGLPPLTVLSPNPTAVLFSLPFPLPSTPKGKHTPFSSQFSSGDHHSCPKPPKTPNKSLSQSLDRWAAIMDSVTSGGGLSYPDSVDSSPRSRGGESWDEPFPSSASSKLRLMCSYGGRIVPRPTDKSLCYLGGDTRIVVVDRLSSLSDLHSKLSRSLLNNRPFTLKYQLPNEDLDSLISVATDDDLDNMIEEYDRIAAANPNPNSTVAPPSASAKSSRVRLFLFPTKPESAPSSIGSVLDDSKSETWFVDALNGAMGIGNDGLPRGLSTDVNCLLGLEDDSSIHSRGGGGGGRGGGDQADPDRMVLSRPDSSGKVGRQDVPSVPDSPMLETNSSFGSTSSAPPLSNLPPIRVRADDRPPDHRYGNIDEHFQQMNISQNPPPLNPPPPIPMSTAAASTPTISPTENPNPNRSFGSDDEKPDPRKQSPMPQQVLSQQQQQMQKPAPIEAPISDSRPVYYQERMPPPPANPEPKREIPVSDPATTYRMQQVPVAESGYGMPTMPAPEQQLHPQQHPLAHPQQHPHAHPQQLPPHAHLQQQQQQQQQPPPPQQFFPANPQFVPISSYYQVSHPMQQSQPYDPSIPMYYLPVRQNQPAVSAVPMPKVAPKPEMQPNLYRTAAPPAPMMHMAAPTADQGHPAAGYAGMGYHVMHHHHPAQAQAAGPPQAMANYGYDYASAATVADTMRPSQAQVYYTPSMPTQYQTVMSEAGQQQTVEVKQNRGS